MENLIVFTESELKELLNKRFNETKFGEHVRLLSNTRDIYEQLKTLDVQFVILGINEHVGLFANHYKTSSLSTWESSIKNLLNIESNRFTQAKQTLILGQVDCHEEQEKLKLLDQNKKGDIKKARKLVDIIDKKVSYIMHAIVKAGKTPIVIGGGHNNAYSIIKGVSLAKNTAIGAINLDVKTRFMEEKGRHSDNGFSYAFAEGFLKRYFVFGLQENYICEKNLKTIKKLKAIQYNTLESITVRKELKFNSEIKNALDHVNNTAFGLSINCNTIEGVGNGSGNPEGFSLNKTRVLVNSFGEDERSTYLFISEFVSKKKQKAKIGGLITTLITDFIRAKQN